MTVDQTRRYGPSALGGRLRRLAERIDEDAARVYAALGIEFEQRWVGIVEHLAQHGPASVTALAAALGISHPSVSQSRRSLEAAGLVVAHADVHDGRSRTLCLTPAGRRLYERLAPLWAVFDEVATALDREAGEVVSALDRLDDALARRSLQARLERGLARRGLAPAPPTAVRVAAVGSADAMSSRKVRPRRRAGAHASRR